MKKTPPDDDDEEREPDLWDICRNYHGGNPESEGANAETDKARDALRIVAYLEPLGLEGATCDQTEIDLGMSHQTASARYADLKKDKVVMRKPNGQRLKNGRKDYERRLTRAGCMAAVNILTKYNPGVIVNLDSI